MDEDSKSSSNRFPKTRWSLVVDVRGGDEEKRRDALGELCQTYWKPVYAFVRQSGNTSSQAEDLTQGFFLDFLKRNSFEGAEQDRGRMRNYLLTALKHFLSKSYSRERTQKRGSGRIPLSIETEEAEGHFQQMASDSLTPDLLYQRRWAEALFERAFDRLQEFYLSRGKNDLFLHLKVTLMGGKPEQGYAHVADLTGETENSIGVIVHRMRQRFRKILEEEIRDTLSNEEDFQDELRNLYFIFQNHRPQV